MKDLKNVLNLMVSVICNSGISFFNHYFKTFKSFDKIFIENFIVNSNLEIGEIKNFIYSANSKSSTGIFDLIKLNNHFQFFSLVKNSNSKVFHFISVHPLNLIQILILKIFKKKIISTIHDLNPHPDWKSPIINFVQSLIIFLSDKIILHNKVDSSKVKKSFFVQLSGYNYLPIKKNYKKQILFFGRIEPYKGIKNIKSLLEYSEYIRDDWKIVIAGKGDLNTNFSEFNNVRIINRFITEEELHDLLSETAFSILPYDSATQSAVILQSISMGIPVISYNVGGLKDYISNWNGYLVEHNDFNEIERILKGYNKSQMQKFENSILENYNIFYSKEAIEKTYKQIYEFKY